MECFVYQHQASFRDAGHHFFMMATENSLGKEPFSHSHTVKVGLLFKASKIRQLRLLSACLSFFTHGHSIRLQMQFIRVYVMQRFNDYENLTSRRL